MPADTGRPKLNSGRSDRMPVCVGFGATKMPDVLRMVLAGLCGRVLDWRLPCRLME